MVVSGLPVRNGNKHAGEIAAMALNLLSCVKDFTVPHMKTKKVQLRIGIHTGNWTGFCFEEIACYFVLYVDFYLVSKRIYTTVLL